MSVMHDIKGSAQIDVTRLNDNTKDSEHTWGIPDALWNGTLVLIS